MRPRTVPREASLPHPVPPRAAPSVHPTDGAFPTFKIARPARHVHAVRARPRGRQRAEDCHLPGKQNNAQPDVGHDIRDKKCGNPGTNVERPLFVPGLPHSLLAPAGSGEEDMHLAREGRCCSLLH